jgi:SCO1/SenC
VGGPVAAVSDPGSGSGRRPRGSLLPLLLAAVAATVALVVVALAQDGRGSQNVSAEVAGGPSDVCPLIGQELGRALELLGGQAGEVAVAAVSVDPEGDTREAVQLWLRRLGLPGNFHYLLGTESELAPVWESYFAAPQQRDVKESLHSASIWLVDRRGRWRAKFSAGVPVPPKDIAHDLRILLGERAA